VLPAPLLGHLLPTLGVGHRIGQAIGFLLGHLSSPAHLRELTLKEGDLLDKAFCTSTSRG
jgi:hypothetical protein